jgi:hypothetical protein
MAESTSNVEFAHLVHEQGHHHESPHHAWAGWVGIAEAILLSIVAIATAWSGYQAAKWDALSARKYAQVERITVMSQEKSTLAGQDRLYDIITFNGWVAAKTAGNAKLVAYYERRFRPEYKVAFDAWMKLDPFNNPSAPAGPIYMAEYASASLQESAKLLQQGKEFFEAGADARETGDRYVKVTVFLATVLLLTALSQRFDVFGPRVAIITIALGLLVISTYWILILPRL